LKKSFFRPSFAAKGWDNNDDNSTDDDIDDDNDDMLDILTDGEHNMTTINLLRKNSLEWCQWQMQMGNNVTRMTETQFMLANQSRTSLKRLENCETVLIALDNHNEAAKRGNILGLDDELLTVGELSGEKGKKSENRGLSRFGSQLRVFLRIVKGENVGFNNSDDSDDSDDSVDDDDDRDDSESWKEDFQSVLNLIEAQCVESAPSAS